MISLILIGLERTGTAMAGKNFKLKGSPENSLIIDSWWRGKPNYRQRIRSQFQSRYYDADAVTNFAQITSVVP
jgi:hypothetical protein